MEAVEVKQGGSYCHPLWTGGEVDFVCLAKEVVTLLPQPDHVNLLLLILAVRGRNPWPEVAPGTTHWVASTSIITENVKSL